MTGNKRGGNHGGRKSSSKTPRGPNNKTPKAGALFTDDMSVPAMLAVLKADSPDQVIPSDPSALKRL